MRIARWVAGILGGLLVLALLTVLTVTVFVDANRFRGQIERAVTRATGQPFEIQGDLEISWFPWLALRTGPSQFGRQQAPSGEAITPIVQWQAARVGARLVPLLKGQLVIDTIRLESPRVHLVRYADGSTNWGPMLEAFRKKDVTPEPATAEQPAPGPQVSGFQIRNGTLDYTDERPGSANRISVSDWSLDVGEWHSGATFPVETQLSLSAGDALRAQNLKLGTRLHISDDANDIDFFEIDFSSRIHAASFARDGLPVEFEVSRTAVRLTPLDISISELAGRVAGNVRFTTSIQAGEMGPDRAFYVRGPIDLQVPSLRRFVNTLGLELPLPQDTSTLGETHLNSTLAWENGAITANPVDIDIDDTHFNGELARTAGEPPLWTFALHGDKIALGRYLSLQDTSDEPFELPVKELKALQARGELTFDQATLGEAQMRGVKLRLELDEGQLRTASK